MTTAAQSARVPIDELHEHPRNARRHDLDVITRSLDKLGQYRPIVVNRGTLTGRPNEILAGHGTVRAAKALGWREVDAVFHDVDDETATNILLVDNRASDLASYDESLLLDLLQGMDDYSITGYSQSDFDALVEQFGDADMPELGDVDESDELDETLPPIYSTESIIDIAYDYWRAQPFPFPTLTRHEILQQVNRLARTRTSSLRSTVTAYGVPDKYHPHRFSTPIPGKATPVESFARDERLRHALKLLADQHTTITANSLRSVLGYVRGTQCAANFRPGFALLLVRTYAPERGVWLDTSTGFGGRLVAFAASQLDGYIGIDPSTPTFDGNVQMVRDLDIADRVSLIKKPAEDVTLAELGGRETVDFAFTSPPYFAKEMYSDEPTQSYQRYKTGDSWRDNFLLPTLALQFAALKSGAVSVVNIADVKIKNDVYPLERWAVECAKAVGFKHEATEKFPLPRVPGQGEASERFEPVLVFRKP